MDKSKPSEADAYRRRQSCDGKRRYKKQSDAYKQVANRDLVIYDCLYCGFWHLAKKANGGHHEHQRTVMRKLIAHSVKTPEERAEEKGYRTMWVPVSGVVWDFLSNDVDPL